MKTTKPNSQRRSLPNFITTALAYFVLLVFASALSAQTKPAPVPKGKAFATPQAAADALIGATENYDASQLTAVLGPDGAEIAQTGEPARDKELANAFAAQARAKMRIEENKTKTRATMIVGEEDWPFPIPIEKIGTHWYFDTKAGKQELLRRRVGRNELDAIQICRGYVEAQNDYA